MYMCVCVDCFSTCANSCGIFKFRARLVWPCMQSIETRDGSSW
jgi:hypothetical protein